jgi:hypothetical protein
MTKHAIGLTAALLAGLVAAAVSPAGQRPTSVTIAAAPNPIVYGGQTALSGSISPALADERVSVQAQACGQNSFTRVADAGTTAGGSWTAAAAPLMNTTYQARVRNVTSQPVTVKVRPRMTLRKVRAHRFRARVFAAQPFAGKKATFQRFSTATQRWVRVRGVALNLLSTGSPTIVSGATFRSAIRSGRRVRIVLPQSQAGACYAAGISGVIRS